MNQELIPQVITYHPSRYENNLTHFFSEYPPIAIQEFVDKKTGQAVGRKSWNTGLTYNQLVSRIEALEKEHEMMRSMIESLSKKTNQSVQTNNTRRNNRNTRNTRKGFVRTLRNKCSGSNCKNE
jgi:hypothetical protein